MDVLPEKAVVGGGPANTAKALARLGQQVEFIGGISSDLYGQSARQELIDDGVGLHYALESMKPTCTAAVAIDKNGAAAYTFTIDGTATFDFGDWLPDPYRYKPSLLHIGSLATIIEPGADLLYQWALQLSELAPIIYDPNIRPAVLPDRKKYLQAVEKWVGISTVVKVSEADLLWLYPGWEPLLVAQDWGNDGVALVVITKGALGIAAVDKVGVTMVGGVEVDVVDTVGAGDTVGAIIAQAVVEKGLANIHGEALRAILDCAAVASAITCSRAGAIPPTKRELIAALESRV
jgi:fructokinase